MYNLSFFKMLSKFRNLQGKTTKWNISLCYEIVKFSKIRQLFFVNNYPTILPHLWHTFGSIHFVFPVKADFCVKYNRITAFDSKKNYLKPHIHNIENQFGQICCIDTVTNMGVTFELEHCYAIRPVYKMWVEWAETWLIKFKYGSIN